MDAYQADGDEDDRSAGLAVQMCTKQVIQQVRDVCTKPKSIGANRLCEEDPAHRNDTDEVCFGLCHGSTTDKA